MGRSTSTEFSVDLETNVMHLAFGHGAAARWLVESVVKPVSGAR